MINKICIICSKEFKVFPCRYSTTHCSAKCRYIHDKSIKRGKNNPMWKGDNVSYKGIHLWLKINYGKANKCENSNCLRTSKIFNWALKKGFSYSHNRDNFINLCRRCHSIYDLKEDSHKKTGLKIKGHKSWNNWQSIKRDKFGRFYSK